MIANVSNTPPVWTVDDLTKDVEQSLRAFLDRRLAEPRQRYRAHVEDRQKEITQLFQTLKGTDPSNPSPDTIRKIYSTKQLYAALRYVAGPPISEDDLAVLATESTDRLTQARMKDDDVLVSKVIQMICRLADPYRFPWIDERREATPSELKVAIRSTAVLHATQTLRTERTQFGREVEERLKERLDLLGYIKAKAPKRVDAPADYPSPKTYFGECTVYGRKADILIGLPDGRLVAVEAKDSSSTLNSVKRVLNDTAAKARGWQSDAGRQIIPVGLLSGVFAAKDLMAAQDGGLYLAWLHHLDSFIEWLDSQG